MPIAAPSQAGIHTQLRLGSVSYLNAKPLIYGLDDNPRVSLALDVPSKLADLLQSGAVDVALLPVIDYQRLENLRIVPAGGIGCNGPTLTVRVFSRQPMDRIDTLACDPDSHTSVALVSVIFAERYGRTLRRIDLRDPSVPVDAARLLIGDKVITEEPRGFPHQLDLGQAWHELTGLPFVFATWMSRPGAELGDWPAVLERGKREGLADVESILDRHAARLGWPREIARKYLTEYLKFDVGPRELEAIRLFHQLAAKHGLIDTPVQPLRF
jgi:chorismate dehydratase